MRVSCTFTTQRSLTYEAAESSAPHSAKSHKSMRKASGGQQKQVESIPDGYRRAIENLPRGYTAGRPMVKMRWRRDLPVTGKAAGSSEWLWVLFMPQYALPTLEEEGGV